MEKLVSVENLMIEIQDTIDMIFIDNALSSNTYLKMITLNQTNAIKTNSHLSLIIKTVERCNLDYTYYYFFNGLDQSYKMRPKFISRGVIDNLIKFLKDASLDFGIVDLIIGLHGGEPLIQPKEDLFT